MQSITTNLSNSPDTIYDAVIVGSGYGASVAALRFAQKYPGAKVAVLERGREWLPGAFPETAPAAVEEFNVTVGSRGVHLGKRDGLYDVRVYREVVTVIGCGLGGGSLINAAVMIEPDPAVFTSRRWPTALRREFERAGDSGPAFEKYYSRAREALGVAVYPETYRHLSKLDLLRDGAQRVLARRLQDGAAEKITFEKTPVAIAFADVTNAAGFVKPACNLCGNCITGCNTGSKGALNTTLLASAWKLGVSIHTGIHVNRLEHDASSGNWKIYYTHSANWQTEELVLKSRNVFLGSGAMGSSEILMRSAASLSLSDTLGTGYSGNGDSLGAAVGVSQAVSTFGNKSFKNEDQSIENSPGPCITSVARIDADLLKPVEDSMAQKVIEATRAVKDSVTNALSDVLERLHLGSASATVTSHHGGGQEAPDIEELLSKQLVIEDCSMPYAAKALFTPLMKGSTVFDHFKLLEQEIIHPEDVMKKIRDSVGEMQHLDDVQHVQTHLVMSHDDSHKSGTMQLHNGTGAFSISWRGWRDQKNYALANQEMMRFGEASGDDYFIPNPAITEADRAVSVHSLGGCCMGDDATIGVVNDKGAVFRKDTGGVYDGLYVVCGAIVPRSLGINPALTISALAERVMEYV
ncbi:hypothetical protein HDU83_001559 [Entophlyctis luteolus]|nr:hypothetical protein HDU82_001482 [Entophlyctis luteolus]KAJ3348132.1 hypothetical protein HDU83_001559 [Entophlyctis luteolus]KAJ3387583.1 hypothetical protein HDU84_000697 [Entophlyctis sp. JEL0112]